MSDRRQRRSRPGVAATLRNALPGVRILVVGDLMLDRYLWGQVQRVSPEAPVPVVRLTRTSHSPGGAANVARNLASLGIQVSLGGVTGADAARDDLMRDMQALGVDTACVVAAENRRTIVKTRVIGNHQQLVRLDEEDSIPVAPGDGATLMSRIGERLAGVDAVILSDYAKGTLTEAVCQQLIAAARAAGIPITVDPKGSDFSRYAGATAITPNRAECVLATGCAADSVDAVEQAAVALRRRYDLDMVVLTLSEKGIVLAERDGEQRIPALAREVFDVSGAGDTVIASFTAALCAGVSPIEAAQLANLAASVVVGKMGTASVTADELFAALNDEAALEQAAKICTLEAVLARAQYWRGRKEQLVFTNGCFDLLHAGHVIYLEKAKRLGHRLIVGLNTDRSVRALKGPERPVIGEQDRARVLAALESVDAVVLFDQPTPSELVRAILPDVLAKGADYTEDQIVGASEVRASGGRVALIPLVSDRSTSGIIDKTRLPTA